MRCPKCQNEVDDKAKFCTKCGCRLETVMVNPVTEPVKKVNVCVKCGASLIPGAKFCTKCGTPVTESSEEPEETKTMFLYGDDSEADTSKTVCITNESPVNVTPVNIPPNPVNVPPVNANPNPVNVPPVNVNPNPVNMNPVSSQVPPNLGAPIGGDIVPPSDTKKKKNKKAKTPKVKETEENKKSGIGLIIVAVILGVLVIASGVVCVLVWNGTITLPGFGSDKAIVKEEETEESSEDTTSTEEETAVNVNAEELFAEADGLLATGKSQIAVDAQVVDGMGSLTEAINQFTSKAEEAGDATLAADRVADAYSSYVTAVIKHKDMMNGQELSGAVYSQIMSELNTAITMGEELSGKGYTADTSSLVSTRDDFDTSYRTRIINSFNEFTSRAAWSRTEAWNLMSETSDNMFESTDLDNPIKLRYAYALSWWIQKQIETELTNGTITAKGAAIKIASMIDVMDYNPMMIKYYIDYMNESGEDCSAVEMAYNDVVDHIAQTQGIRIGQDIPLDHFWYFNDFGTYSVDPTNGVTPENRQWIRDRMSQITFVTQ